VLQTHQVQPEEWKVLAAVLLAGGLTGLIPAWRAAAWPWPMASPTRVTQGV
jgi:hypothetical protein